MADQPQTPVATMTCAATPRSQQYVDSLNRLRALADQDRVPSGVLLTSAATLFSLARYDGTQAAGLGQAAWEQYYHDLHAGRLPGSTAVSRLPPLEELRDKARAHYAQGHVPIALVDVDYHVPNKRLLVAISSAARDDRAIRVRDDPATMLEAHRAFIASALLADESDNFQLLPHRHRGLHVQFVLDPDMHVSNTPDAQGLIEIDFDDGFGWRSVVWGRPVAVTYAAPGNKVIRVARRADSGGLTRQAAFTFEVVAPADVQPDTSFTVTATIPYQGKTNTGLAYVKYGSTNGTPHTQLINPVILSEGFPGGYTWDYLYEMLNAQGALTSLLNAGYDAVVLTYGTPGQNAGSDFIQRSAFVAVACIQKVIQMRAGANSLIVGGASMGGVITRYALAYMESNSLPHQARIFLSFDSPQQGANAPVSVQWFIQALGTESVAAGKLATLLTSPAARQMLYYCVPNYTYNGPLTDPLHTNFYAELAVLGYPRQLKTIGISDGAGNGTQVIPDRAHVIDWWGNACAYGDTWAEMTGSGQVASLYCEPISFWKTYSCFINNCINFDGAPGGTANANGQLAQQLIDSDYGWVSHNYDINCFIPTVSGLDIFGASAYTSVSAQGAPSAFNAYFVSSANNAHVLITPEILTFLLSQLGTPAQVGMAIDRGHLSLTAADHAAEDGEVLRPAAAPGSTVYTLAAELSAASSPSELNLVGLSGDGNTACVLAEDGLYVFAQAQGVWILQQKLASEPPTSVALSDDGTVIAVASPHASNVTVFSGTNWSSATTLTPKQLSAGSWPYSVALTTDGTCLAVGIPDWYKTGPGQAVVYQASGAAWTVQQTLTGASSEWSYGFSVALNQDGSVLVVSGCTFAPNNLPYSGYAYAYTGSQWATATELPPPNNFQPGYGVQCCVNASGSVIAVVASGSGAWQGNPPGNLFVFSGQNWQERSQIVNPNSNNFELWPAALDAAGSMLVAVASNPSSEQQSLYVFTSSGNSWGLAQTVQLPAAAQNTSQSGVGVSDDGSTIVLGASSAGAYVLSGAEWNSATQLATPVEIAGLAFGAALAVTGKATAALVGAPGSNNLQGLAYLYAPNGNKWALLETIPSPNPESFGQLACSLAINGNGDTAIFGERGDDNSAGCAYILSGHDWRDQIRLTAPVPTSLDNFGVSVAVSDDGSVCVVGAPGTDGNTGIVYIYSGSNWSTTLTIQPSSAQPSDNVGRSVAISADGTVIAAGAPNTNGGVGAVYVFYGSNWSEQVTLTPPSSAGEAAFGYALALSDDGSVMLVGAPRANESVGGVYALSGASWSQLAAITVTATSGDLVGNAVAMTGDGATALIGAPGTQNGTGAAYLATGAGFSNVQTLSAPDGAQADRFGEAVSMDALADVVAVGAPGREYETGATYLFTSATQARVEDRVIRSRASVTTGNGRALLLAR